MRNLFVLSLVMTNLFFYAQQVQALECKDLSVVTAHFHKYHIYERSYNDKISKRTFELFLRSLDPLKMYFLSSDIENFKLNNYHTLLDDQDKEKSCEIIDNITKVYQTRYRSYLVQMKQFVQLQHDFSIDENIYLDPNHYDYADDPEILSERRRKFVKFEHMRYLDTLEDKEIRKKLTTQYELREKRFQQEKTAKIYDKYLNAFARSLDPNSQYESPINRDGFRDEMRGSFFGIGVLLTEEDGITKVAGVVAGGPASKQGELKKNDKILGVAQGGQDFVDVVGTKIDEVVSFIRGQRGTTVRLLILRKEPTGNRKLRVAIVRDEVELKDQQAKGHIYRINDLKRNQDLTVGVINIPRFYKDFAAHNSGKKDAASVTRDVTIELSRLLKEKVQALIIDLRGNLGGALDESISLSNLFLPTAPVLQQSEGRKFQTLKTNSNKMLYRGPLVVLTDLYSASASEIFAGAIKDNGRGIILGGKKTHGKGTVQTIHNFEKNIGQIRVTVNKFYTPNGHSTQIKGVIPDIQLPSLLDASYDPENDHGRFPIPWEKVVSAKLLGLRKNTVEIIQSLDSLSKERRSSSGFFRNVERDIHKVMEIRSLKSPVSLLHEHDSMEKDDSEAEESQELEEGDEEEHITLENKAPLLDQDYLLEEALYITSDYYYLLNKKAPGIYQPINHVSDTKHSASGCSANLGTTQLKC